MNKNQRIDEVEAPNAILGGDQKVHPAKIFIGGKFTDFTPPPKSNTLIATINVNT